MRGAWLLVCALAWWLAAPAGAADPVVAGVAPVVVLRIDGAIGPATADHIVRALREAAERRAALVVLQMDTPGGLDTAMREIIKAILASPVPVAAYVAPSGARAASAGTYILYAAHVAAMAPATTLGAATPVAIGPGGAEPEPAPRASAAGGSGDTLAAKRVSDAAAYIRSLALLRGRNADWGERAVREAVSLPATEALAQKVVEVIATDAADLLRQLDGRVLPGSTAALATAHAPVETVDADWRSRLLAVIAEPGLALLLMMIGFYGLMFEFSNPGFVAPGVIGAVCLLLGLYGLQTLPLNYAGLALLLLGIGFFVAEVFMPSYGALGLGGTVAFVLGAVMLIDSGAPGLGIPPGLIGALALASLAVVVALGLVVGRSRHRPPAAGPATLLGAVGAVTEADGASGWAIVNGEHWRVRGAAALRAGEQVRVKAVNGLTLDVEGAG